MAEAVASGRSVRSIVRELNEEGITPPHAAEWTATGLSQLLLKPTYIGQRVYDGKVLGAASWEPILDEVTYYACVKILTDPARRTQRTSTVRYLLSGIALCGRCPRSERRPMRPATSSRSWSYVCVHCHACSIRVGMLDDHVQAAVLAVLESPAFAAALVADAGDDRVREALALAQELERQLAEARQLAVTVVDGRMGLSAASLAGLEAQLQPQIDAARERARDDSVPPLLYDLTGPDAREVWEKLDLAQRRTVLRAVVRPWVNPAGKGVRSIRPGRVELDWLRGRA
jgi:hypothetical protein